MNTPRAAVMAVFGGFGVAAGVFAGSIPALIRQAGLTSGEFGLAMAVATTATMLAFALSGLVARRVSNRAALLALIPLIALSVVAVMGSQSLPAFFAANIVFGLAMGGTDLFMNAEAGAIEHDLGRPVFTAFHAVVSVAIALSAFAGGYASIMFDPLVAVMLPVVALAVSWLMVWRFVPARPAIMAPATGHAPLPNRRALLILGVISGLCISCELAAIQWSAKLLDDQAPALAAIAGLGVAFYGLCNALVRFGGDRLRARFGDLATLRVSLLVAMAGFTALGLSTSFTGGVAAFAVIGFGAALLTPCTFAAMARLAPDAKAQALGFASLVASPSRVISPFLFGWVAAEWSTVFAFALCGAVLAVALALTFLLKSETLMASPARA